MADLPPEAVLEVAGEGDPRHRREVESAARDCSVAGRVRLLGAQPHSALGALYASADAVVFPVEWDEPWGLVPLEAMSVGRPVAATGTGGSGEYLRDGVNCLIFRAGDPASLAAALRGLADDPALRQRLQESGRATAATYTEEGCNRALEHAIVELASARR
jgi:glycogen synthase